MNKLLLACKNIKPYLWDNKEFCEFIQKSEGVIEPRYILGNRVSKKEAIKCNCINAVNLNGKIILECDYEVEEILEDKDSFSSFYKTVTLSGSVLKQKSCMSNYDLIDYLGYKKGYAIHIKNLKIYDTPKNLSDYEMNGGKPFTKMPSRMCNAYIKEGGWECCDVKTILALTPQEMCRILNGKQTVIIRKNILKDEVEEDEIQK